MNKVMVLSILLLIATVGKSQSFSDADSSAQKQFSHLKKNRYGMTKSITYPIGQAHPIVMSYELNIDVNSDVKTGFIKIKDSRKFAGFEQLMTVQESIAFMQGLDSLLKNDFSKGCKHETQYFFSSITGLFFVSECDGTGWKTKLVLEDKRPEWAINCDKDFLLSLRELLRFAIDTAEHYKSKN